MQTPPCLMPRGDKGGAVRSAAGAAGTASLKECGKVGPGTLSLRLRLRKVSQSDINGNRRTVRARCATRSFPLLQTDETQGAARLRAAPSHAAHLVRPQMSLTPLPKIPESNSVSPHLRLLPRAPCCLSVTCLFFVVTLTT